MTEQSMSAEVNQMRKSLCPWIDADLSVLRRVNTLIASMLEGLRVGEDNREQVRHGLCEMMLAAEAAAESRGRLKGLEEAAKIADEYALGDEYALEDRLHDNATNIAAAIRFLTTKETKHG